MADADRFSMPQGCVPHGDEIGGGRPAPVQSSSWLAVNLATRISYDNVLQWEILLASACTCERLLCCAKEDSKRREAEAGHVLHAIVSQFSVSVTPRTTSRRLKGGEARK